MKKFFISIILCLNVIIGFHSTAHSMAENKLSNQVVVSIKPLHSLVAGVMKGVGTPYLIVKNSASPHTYRMKPSDARALGNAKIVFWVGPEFENFLKKPITRIAKKSLIVSLFETKGLIKRKFRQDTKINLSLSKKQSLDGGHDKHDEHSGLRLDPHIWLDPVNGKKLVAEIVRQFVKIDNKNSAIYKQNATKIIDKLDILVERVSQKLEPVQQQKYLVFHDAYQYFEKRFGLEFSGSVVLSTNQMAGAKRLKKMQQRIKKLQIKCIFFEPQFNPRLVKTIARGQGIKLAVLDPMGASLEQGPALYSKLILNMATAFENCFR